MQNKFNKPTKQEPKSFRPSKISKRKQNRKKNIPVRYSNFEKKTTLELISDTRNFKDN